MQAKTNQETSKLVLTWVVQDVIVMVVAGLCLAMLVSVQPKCAFLCWAWLYLLLSLFYNVEQGLLFCVCMALATFSLMSAKTFIESPNGKYRMLGVALMLLNMTTIARICNSCFSLNKQDSTLELHSKSQASK